MPTRSPRRSALSVAFAIAALALTASPAGAVVTTSQSGSPGYWYGHEGTNICDGSPREITTLQPMVMGSSAYPNSNQQISMIPKYEYSGDGANWYHGGWGNWQSVATFGTSPRRFASQSTNINVGGYYWRVKMVFRWYVGGHQIGEATNLFNASGSGWGEYSASQGAATVSNRSGGFCLIY
jgi:hypothetical protein